MKKSIKDLLKQVVKLTRTEIKSKYEEREREYMLKLNRLRQFNKNIIVYKKLSLKNITVDINVEEREITIITKLSDFIVFIVVRNCSVLSNL